jgi:hypothetical protein
VTSGDTKKKGSLNWLWAVKMQSAGTQSMVFSFLDKSLHHEFFQPEKQPVKAGAIGESGKTSFGCAKENVTGL